MASASSGAGVPTLTCDWRERGRGSCGRAMPQKLWPVAACLGIPAPVKTCSGLCPPTSSTLASSPCEARCWSGMLGRGLAPRTHTFAIESWHG